jgi:hypothetical protein
LADRYAIGRTPKFIAQIAKALANWPRFAREAGLNETAIQSVAADFRLL